MNTSFSSFSFQVLSKELRKGRITGRHVQSWVCLQRSCIARCRKSPLWSKHQLSKFPLAAFLRIITMEFVGKYLKTTRPRLAFAAYIDVLHTPGWLVSTLRPRPLRREGSINRGKMWWFQTFFSPPRLHNAPVCPSLLTPFPPSSRHSSRPHFLQRHKCDWSRHILHQDTCPTPCGQFGNLVQPAEMGNGDTFPSCVSFVRSRGVPCTSTTRPVGIRAMSTSMHTLHKDNFRFLLHPLHWEMFGRQLKTCISLAWQLHPVIGNSVFVAQVEVSVVGRVHHGGSRRRCSHPWE